MLKMARVTLSAWDGVLTKGAASQPTVETCIASVRA